MNKKIKDIDDLISKAADYLDAKLGFSPCTVKRHLRGWLRIRKFMTATGIKLYSVAVERQVHYHYFSDREYKSFHAMKKNFTTVLEC